MIPEITPDKAFKSVLRMTAEWPERTEAFSVEFLHRLVTEVKDDVEKRIPGDQEWSPYKKSLKLRRVSGLGKWETGVLLFADLPSRKVAGVDAPTTLLYIQVRRRLRRVPPELRVLQRFSPWTYSTLPFVPDKHDATIVSRRVRLREVERVEKMRKRDKPKWRAQLDKVGVRITDKERAKKMREGLQTVPDIAFEAIRLEFGLGEGKGSSHWKPALHNVRQHVLTLSKRKQLTGFLTDPKNKGWKQPEGEDAKKVAASELQRYESFQKALRVRF